MKRSLGTRSEGFEVLPRRPKPTSHTIQELAKDLLKAVTWSISGVLVEGREPFLNPQTLGVGLQFGSTRTSVSREACKRS